MIIDIHAHAFADAIAERTIAALAYTARSNCLTDGTLSGLIRKMDDWGIDKFTVLSTATKPSQHEVILNWCREIASDRIIPFASVHPDEPDIAASVREIKTAGIRGIKFHPDYQDIHINHPKMLKVFECCAKEDMLCIIHAGYDPISPDEYHAPPAESREVHEKIPELRMILAHVGGMFCWDDVEAYLVGLENVYFDTAYCTEGITPEQLTRIINNHGAEKILFGSDMPWCSAEAVRDMLMSLDLTQRQRDLIFYKNAESLLNL